ncbi:MAG: Hsp33 family molecular chaperone HslO [Firmicutes bacterium HGW-Firmicutes-15]|nr:MAG: Hsp33 family molecular chaperone HslO [Firmicutes bacterium HGW-Firmicutes-15]
MKRDYLLKIMDHEKNFRVYLARTTSLVEEAHRRHGTSATASAALGRLMTAAIMMASDLKGEDDILTLRVNGNGPAGTVLATADSQGGVRGLISNPFADLPSNSSGKLAVGELVGTDGEIEVIKDMGMKQPFSGRVALLSGEIAEDLAQYFLLSEQIPSLVSLGVLVSTDLSIQAAGGLFVQALPGAGDEALEMIENNILALGPITAVLDSYDRLEDILPLIMHGIEYAVVGQQEIAFRCNCSREKLGKVLSGLAMDEIESESSEDIEVFCNFCQERYSFTPQEILARKSNKP